MRSKVTLRNKSIDNAGIPSDYKLAIADIFGIVLMQRLQM